MPWQGFPKHAERKRGEIVSIQIAATQNLSMRTIYQGELLEAPYGIFLAFQVRGQAEIRDIREIGVESRQVFPKYDTNKRRGKTIKYKDMITE